MKKLLNLFTITALLVAVGFMSVSCGGETTAPTKKELGVTIALGTLTSTSVSVIIMPQKDATGYNYAIGQASDLAAFMDGTLEGIKKQTDLSVTEVEFSGLDGGMEYTVFVQAFAGDEKGQLATRAITTPKDPSQYDFELEFNLEPTRTEIFVRFSEIGKDVEEYDYAVGTPSDLAAFEEGTLKGITRKKGTVKSVIISGLKEKVEYTVFVRAISGDTKGPVISKNTRTVKMVLDVVVTDITSTTAKVTITPSGDTARYRYALDSIEALPLFESGILPSIVFINDTTKALTLTLSEGGKPDTEYCLFTQAFAGNNTKGDIQITKFRTLPADAK